MFLCVMQPELFVARECLQEFPKGYQETNVCKKLNVVI